MIEEHVSFRALTPADLPLMHRWLNQDHVVDWYGAGNLRRPTLEQVEKHYLPRVRGAEPTRGFVVQHEERPVGYIQMYFVDDYPENARAIELESWTPGIDLFVGEREMLGQGFGTAVLRAFSRELIFSDPRVTMCIVAPSPDNARAIRCYEKAGFRHLKTIDVPGAGPPGDPPKEYLMVLTRSDIVASAY